MIIIGLLIAYIYCPRISQYSLRGLIVLLVGLLYFNIMVDKCPSNLKPVDQITITGKIMSYPKYNGEKTSFIIKNSDNNKKLDKIQVYLDFKYPASKGDVLTIQGKLDLPAQPGNPGEFDYASYLANQHIYYILSVEDTSNIDILSPADGMQKWINYLREQGQTVIKNNLTDSEANILLAMLLGMRVGIDDEDYDTFQKIGIAHVFAVSGIHVGFLLLFITLIAGYFNLSSCTKICLASCLLLIYGTVAGWPVSVIRASIMAFLGLLAFCTGRENALIDSLGLAGIIILVIDPQALFTVSFQLSFLATWGIIYLYPLVKKYLKLKGRGFDLIIVPLCAQVTTLPLMAYYFNIFSPMSLISNIITTYMVGIIVILGFIAFVFASVWPAVAFIFLYPTGLIIEVVLLISTMIENLPGAYLWVATPRYFVIIFYYAGLLIITLAVAGKRSRTYIYTGGIIISLSLLVICLPAGVYNRGYMEVVFIDVGQGDSILIKTPEGRFILIDGGGSDFYDVAARKLLPYLRYRGIREIYMVFNTHPDTDHLRGLEKIIEDMPVKFVGLPRPLYYSPEYDRIKKLAENRQARMIALQKGARINISSPMSLVVLYPPEGEVIGSNNNNLSLVIRCGYQKFSLLLTGDLERESIIKLTETNSLQPVSMLKVPHHGSRGSLVQDLYNDTRPLWAVICAGRNNPFGHPHKDVLNLLEKQKIAVMRTDLHGAITVITDGQEVKITTYKQPEKRITKRL